MASTDWTTTTDSLPIEEVDRGVTAGIARPNGGGGFVYGMNSLEVVEGAVALFSNQADFAPMASGGSVRGALKRGVSGGPTGFSPFLFIGLQGTENTDSGYLLGLGDADPHHIVLAKGRLDAGVPDLAPNAPLNGVLMRSTEGFNPDTWLHLRLDMIVQGTGDTILQVFRNDLDANTVDSPVWESIPGMAGPLAPDTEGFVDDSVRVATGSAPFASGRAGFGMAASDVTRRAFFDHIQVARQT